MAEKKEPFVSVPHWLMDYLMRAKFNMTQYQILLTVIRYTYGFNKEWGQFSISFLVQKTGAARSRVTEELKALKEMNILTERYEEKNKRLFRLNEKVIRSNVTEVSQEGSPPSGTTRGPSSRTTDSPPSGTHIKKDIKEKGIKEKHYIALESDDHFINIYLNYLSQKKKKHPIVTEEQREWIINQIDYLRSYEVTAADWEEQVKDHFEHLPKSNNGNIIAFLHASHRRFDIGMYDQF